MNTHRRRHSVMAFRAAICGVLVATMSSVAVSTARPRFFPDDPITREPDPADASKVQPFPIHLTWDLVSSLFVKEGTQSPTRARNINTIDEVPDSSWFTNRVGSRPLTEVDIARGPDTTYGPVGRWTVVSGKSEGVRPGFTVRDDAGIVWFVKFDAPGYPEQATGAEAVATKLFWALGYNVAETHVATIRRADLLVSPHATIAVHGKKRPLTAGDIDRMLAQVDRDPDHTYRAIASKALEGKPVGEFLYYGTRPDDPNDVVPHEDRRELRAMGVFAAWIDRVDAKAGNTLDTLVTVDGRTAVRHHVLDFGSTLGSAGIAPNEPWEGYQYLYGGAPLLKKLLGFGFPIETWRTIRYPNLRGIGRIEADHFAPDEWRSRVPNPAYVRANADDTFWAAHKLMAMTSGMIAAAVKNGEYTDRAAEDYLTHILIQRRDAILRRYLPAVNPTVNVTLDEKDSLTFENAAVLADVAGAPTLYRARWSRFDNLTDTSTLIGDTASPETVVRSPDPLSHAEGTFVRVDIAAGTSLHADWASPVTTYFARRADRWTLVGLDRTAPTDSRVATIPRDSARP
jgi:hypothetical protein